MCVNTPARKTCCFPGSSKTIWPLPFLPIPGSQRLDESGLPNPPCLDGSQFVYLFICYLILCVYCYCLAYIRHFWMWVVEILSVVSNQKTVVSDLLVCVFQGEVNFFQSRKHVLEHLTDMFFFSPGQKCQI